MKDCACHIIKVFVANIFIGYFKLCIGYSVGRRAQLINFTLEKLFMLKTGINNNVF